MTEIRWEQRGLIRVPVIVEEPPKRKPARVPQPTTQDWDEETLREAHRRYYHGERDLTTCEGERVYQARRKRAQRSGAMSPVDRVWAEKNAVKGSWVLDTKNNRRASVSNTT